MESLLTDAEKGKIYIAGGFAHPNLTGHIANSIGMEVGNVKQKTHPNGELFVQYEDCIRGKHVFIVQPHVGNEQHSVNDAIMQQCLLVDAAKRASAKRITAVAPYFGYSRADRKDDGRVPIGMSVVIRQLAKAGAKRLVAVDLHSRSTLGIFKGPFDNLVAQPLLRGAMAEEIASYDPESFMVVAPDAGASKIAEQHWLHLGGALLNLSKMREKNDTLKIRREQKIPEASGRVCVLFDDMIDTASTIVSAAEALKNSGAEAVFVAGTHPVFSDPALTRLKEAPIDKIIVTDTFPTTAAEAELGDKLRVVRIAPFIGEGIIRIVQNRSVSEILE